MSIREIQAKTLLSTSKDPGAWFGVRYNMNLYRGCEHRCIYCDSRSECYGIEDFDGELCVKVNALELLDRELLRKQRIGTVGTVGTGAMTDPYTPSEKQYRMTGGALEIIARRGFPVHITTKSDLILRDLPILYDINSAGASVSITLTTMDDALARKLEPAAPPPSARLNALARLAEAGITVGVMLMPVLPFIEDSPESLRDIITQAADAGASYVIPWLGVSLRDRQRAHYYAELDRHFPGLRAQYERRYGDRYFCASPNTSELERVLRETCAARRLKISMRDVVAAMPNPQLSLF